MAKLTLPETGKDGSKATVFRWRRGIGQKVGKGDVLVEVDTNQGVMEVIAPVDGVVQEVCGGPGMVVEAGQTIALLGDGGAVSAQPAVSKPAVQQVVQVKENKPMSSAKASGPVVPVVMPKAGQSMEEGTLIKWRVQPGAQINKGDVIFEIETDKATMDVEATDSGRLAKILLPEGGVCKVMEPVALLADSDADAEAYMAGAALGAGPAPAAVVPSDETATAAGDAGVVVSAPVVSESGRVKASPAARRIASERGVDLASVGAGSGPGGRIISTDVPATKAAPAGVPSPAKAAPAATAVRAAAPVPVATGDVVRKPMTKMRKAIAQNLSLSKQTIPHFYIKATINAEPLFAFYQGEKAKYPCSVNDVILMAAARIMMEFAPFRSRAEGDQVATFPSANIGIAVGMDEGLVVPVLVGAEKLTLQQIGAESKRLATTARAGKIEGLGKGLMTITNMGMFGVEEFYAIINPPESAILAVGTIREDVIVSGGTLRPGKVMTMTLSVDHRIIDGVLAAKYLANLKEMLEYPQQLM